MKDHDSPEKTYDLERLIFFSDGVFAIVITLLVIELHPPEDWHGGIPALLTGLAPKLIPYLISFAAIGGFWMSHRLMFRYVQRFTERAAWINLLFLALIGLTPLANLLISHHYQYIDSIFAYVGLMVAISIVGGLLWGYLSLVERVVDPNLTLAFRMTLLFRLCINPPLICAASLWAQSHYGLVGAIVAAVAVVVASSFVRASPYRKVAEAEA